MLAKCLMDVSFSSLDTSLELFQSYGPSSRCFRASLDACSHTPACLNTTIYRYTPTGDLAYTIQGDSSIKGEIGM